ncbi:MAG: PAS domain S-box protein, partial [Cytophagales bacterium]
IGKGDLQADFKPASQSDSLGTALLTMRNSISSSQERDEERTWIVEGLAEIGDILPSITKLEELGDLVCEFVTKKIGAVQGAFYTVNDSDASNLLLEMNASYAYNKKKYLKSNFKFAEGLVGQAAIEKDIIVRTEIPNDYVTISSGILGDQKPKCILVAPLITNENVYGVVEFAGFERFEHREIEFIKEISELIARTVFNIKVNQRTAILLEESQKLTSELQLQQEVLRQNAEIMEATQVELERTNLELQSQIQEVQKATDRTRLLLENASEVITIYEPNGTIRYISPSAEKILGYSQDEMTGLRDVTHIHPAGKETFEQMFRDLLANPDEKITIQFSYFIKNGERIWLEATGINLLSDAAIQGIIVNSRDIT